MGEHKLTRPCKCGHTRAEHTRTPEVEGATNQCEKCGCSGFDEREHRPRTPEEFKMEIDAVMNTCEGEEFGAAFCAVALVYGGVLAALDNDAQRASLATIANNSYNACRSQDRRLIVPS